MEDYIVVIETSSDLSPHIIRLKPGTKSIKQKYYRLYKFQSDILMEKLIKQIDKKLIKPILFLIVFSNSVNS